MDAKKTGAVIALRRKELELTQKQLAEQLNISDRTVSKWERGAGLPDVSILIPLADALDISVAALLQGEAVSEENAELSVRNAVNTIYLQTKRKLQKDYVTIIATVCLSMFLIWYFWLILDYSGAFLKDVSLSVPVTIYREGEAIDESVIFIDGKRNKRSFAGTFAIEYVERTTRENVQGYVGWGEEPREYDFLEYSAYGGPWDCGIKRMIYISEDMKRMALKLEDGTILATDEALMKLMSLGGWYPLEF